MSAITSLIPPVLAGFLGTIMLALLIGLELHAYRRRSDGTNLLIALGFGTTRTITLIAAFGFVLWTIAPVLPFCIGFGVIGLLLALDYNKRLHDGDASLLASMVKPG